MAAILVVEDEPPIADFLERGLSISGHAVTVSTSGEGAVLEFSRFRPDLVLLDLVLPGLDGIDVCRSIRARSQAPVIVLSARDSIEDRVRGLDAGADDYLVKPFSFAELLARIRAALRRGGTPGDAVLRAGALGIDTASRSIVRGGRRIALTMREFDLLLLLAENAGRVVPRRVIQERVWGHDWESDNDPVKVYVSYLRKKLNQPGEPDVIQSCRGIGYMLRK